MIEVEQTLYNYIMTEAADRAPAHLDADYDLIGSGVMDSLFMMMVVSFLEQKYQFEFGLNDIVPENFRSINALSAYVNRAVTGAA
jgi:acyl carrier protein